MKDYMVIDLETSIKHKYNAAYKATPFNPENKIVAMGYTTNTLSDVHVLYNTYRVTPAIPHVVGCNIKFDLHYLMRDIPDFRKNIHKYTIHDVQLVEYLITGQDHQWASLNELALKYGGTVKDEKIAEYWNRGVDTEDIPEEELCEYLRQDVLNTEKVYLGQLEVIKNLGPKFEKLVEQMNAALLATTEMEFNGMWFDVIGARSEREKLHNRWQSIEEELIKCMKLVGIVEPNPLSLDHVSLYLFGGVQKVEASVPVLNDDGTQAVYKTGSKKGVLKWKKGIKEIHIPKLYSPRTLANKRGYYKVDDSVLSDINDSFCKMLLELRSLAKDISTYYDGYSSYAFSDNLIHPHLNHCATATGRLSCTQPNLQNTTSMED